MLNESIIIVFEILILVMSVVIHEVSHGLAAFWQGDSTAKYAGRLTLNPFKHLDFWGSFVVPLLMIFTLGLSFGWAKPVPYNPYNLRDQRKGPALVGLAGPASNIIVALIFGFSARLISINYMAKLDIVGNLFNMDFEKLAFNVSGSFSSIFFLLLCMIAMINIFLAFFNLIPIPPLDGSKLLFSFLPMQTKTKIFLEQFGFTFLLLFIMLFSGVLGFFLSLIRFLFFRYVIGM